MIFFGAKAFGLYLIYVCGKIYVANLGDFFWVFPKLGRFYPQMDGENKGQTPKKHGMIWGGNFPLFLGSTPRYTTVPTFAPNQDATPCLEDGLPGRTDT